MTRRQHGSPNSSRSSAQPERDGLLLAGASNMDQDYIVDEIGEIDPFDNLAQLTK
jgi:hypothetical protein